MKRVRYVVYEYFPTEDGEDKHRVWCFEKEEDAEQLISFIEQRDCLWPCLKVEKVVFDCRQKL